MTLPYSRFIKELRKAKNWKAQDVADRINKKFAPAVPVTVEQYYSWEEGENEPRAGFTKAVEAIFEINLDPTYFGFKEARKP